MMKGKKKYLLNIAVILLIGGTVIYLSIGNQWKQVVDAFAHANLGK